jgi:HAD superfamily hydrolase (TIGR01549 family)
MMITNIDAIFLDVGNTLRILLKEEPHRAAARKEIASLVGTQVDPGEFCAELDSRYKVYRKWAFDNLVEASEKELWTRWLLPDFPETQIAPLSAPLTYQFRQSMGRRVMAEGGKDTVIELYNRGYIMGIITNVITEREIPEWLDEDGLTKYFKSVVLSSVFGKRKPDVSIYLEAARRAEVDPSKCVYIGDNFSRDVEGTRKAGFGMVIILPDPKDDDEPVAEENKPDLIIHKLSDLLEYFPARQVNLNLNTESLEQ